MIWELSADTDPNAAEIYRQGVADLFDISLDEPASAFRNRLEVYHLGEIAICRCSGVGQRFTRTPLQAHKGIDHIQVVLLLDGGPWAGDYDGRRADSAMGDLRLMDMARPFDVHSFAYETLNLIVPRAVLEDVSEHDLHGLVLSTRLPATRLAASHIRELWSCLPEMSMDEAMAAARALTTLLASAIRAADPPRAARRPLERSLFGVARDFIDRNLGDPDLSPAKIQAHLAVSRAMVYRLFESVGGVSAYVRRRRLDRAAVAVAAAPRSGRTLSQVAFEHGFRSDSQFSRAFRARFGMTPGELKSGQSRRQQADGPSDDVQRAFSWFWDLNPGARDA